MKPDGNRPSQHQKCDAAGPQAQIGSEGFMPFLHVKPPEGGRSITHGRVGNRDRETTSGVEIAYDRPENAGAVGESYVIHMQNPLFPHGEYMPIHVIADVLRYYGGA